MTAFAGNTNYLQLTGLYDAVSAAYVNNATVTVTISDASGVEVMASTSMAYVSSSSGNYRATVPYDTGLLADRPYTATVTAVSGSTRGVWEFQFKPRTRREV